jgi:hypothetical protein
MTEMLRNHHSVPLSVKATANRRRKEPLLRLLPARKASLVALFGILWLSLNTAAQADSPFSVSIVSVGIDYTHLPELSTAGRVYVVLTNTSQKPVTIYTPDSAWGFYSLTFEAIDAKGKHFTFNRSHDGKFDSQFPETFTVLPEHEFVVPVFFGWTEWPSTESIQGIYQVKAIFEEPSGPAPPDAANPNIWRGRAESKLETFHLDPA